MSGGDGCYGHFSKEDCNEYDICCAKEVVVTPEQYEEMGSLNDTQASSAFFTNNAPDFSSLEPDLVQGLIDQDIAIQYKTTTNAIAYYGLVDVTTDETIKVLPVSSL